MSAKILFSTGRTKVSEAIRWITGSPVSHCGVYLTGVDGLCGADIVLAEDIGGFRPILFEVFKQSNDVVRIFDPVVDIRPGVVAELPKLGAGYDYSGLVGDGIDIAEEKLFPRLHPRNWLHEPGAMFCSNVLTRILRNVRYPRTESLEPVKTSPAQLYSLSLSLAA